MGVDYRHTCPQCQRKYFTAFPGVCPCGFNIERLTGRNLSQFQQTKWNKHTQLYHGQQVSLIGEGDYNASFNSTAIHEISDIVNFCLTFGSDSVIESNRGGHQNPVRIVFLPKIIGEGVSIDTTAGVSVSGCCIISPASINFGHIYPALTPWVKENFSTESTCCRSCGTETPFAMPFCEKCYPEHGSDWLKLLA